MTRSPVGRLAGEFVVIVVGVLVALGLESWYGDRQDARRGEAYLERIEADLRNQIQELDSAAVGGEEALVHGGHLLMYFETGAAPEETFSHTVFLAMGGRRFEVPVTDWTYREMQGNAQLGLIRDPALRAALVKYFATAHGYAGRIEEVRAELRSPAYAWFGRTPALRTVGPGASGQASAAERRLREPGASEYMHGLLTYVDHRQIMLREWTAATEETLALLEAR